MYIAESTFWKDKRFCLERARTVQITHTWTTYNTQHKNISEWNAGMRAPNATQLCFVCVCVFLYYIIYSILAVWFIEHLWMRMLMYK